MKKMLAFAALVAALLGFACAPAAAQNPICATMPPGDSSNACASTEFVQSAMAGKVSGPGTSVVGDLAIWNNTSGTLLADSGASLVSSPIVHPSSGNLACTQGHALWFVDQNICTTADVLNMVSSDPSAIFIATIGGTITNGDTVRLKFEFGSGACIAGVGCTVTANVTGASTTTTIAAALVAAIKANTTLFTSPNGGYAGGAQIAYVVNTGGQIALDFNSTVPMKVTSSVTGAATETVTIVTVGCGTTCAAALDNNPALEFGRNTGVAPQSGSVIFAIQAGGTTSASPASIVATYGGKNLYVENSTTGALAARWCDYTTNTDASLSCRQYVGRGIYTASTTDKGVDSYNSLQYWVNSVYEIFQSGNSFQLSTGATNHPIILQPGNGGVGVLMSPTGSGVEVNAGVSAFGTGTAPSAGSGTSFFGSATPAAWSVTWTTAGAVSAYLPQNWNALSWDFRPSNSSTSGWSLLANVLRPDADNATTLGDGSHNISTVFTKAISGMTTPLSLTQGGTNASLTASNGGIVWSDASKLNILAGTATANLPLLSGATATPAWATVSYPTSATSGGVPYFSSTSVMASSAALAANGIVVGGGAGVAPNTGTGCTLSTYPIFTCASANTQGPQLSFTNTTSDTNSVQINMLKSRGAGAVQSGDSIFNFFGQAFANAGFNVAASFGSIVAGAPSGSNVPTKWTFVTSNAAGLLNQTLAFDNLGHVSAVVSIAPTTGTCGTSPAIVSGSNDNKGSITAGTGTPTSCTINFGTTWGAAPKCIVGSNPQLAAFSWTVSTTQIVVTQTATSSNVITWDCGLGNAFLLRRDLGHDNDNRPMWLDEAA